MSALCRGLNSSVHTMFGFIQEVWYIFVGYNGNGRGFRPARPPAGESHVYSKTNVFPGASSQLRPRERGREEGQGDGSEEGTRPTIATHTEGGHDLSNLTLSTANPASQSRRGRLFRRGKRPRNPWLGNVDGE